MQLIGGKKDPLEKVRQAAEWGDAEAQLKLGVVYYEGKGVPQDYVKAACWFRKAADQGNADAQGMLGFMYDEGDGVPQDHVEASHWLRKAADGGKALA